MSKSKAAINAAMLKQLKNPFDESLIKWRVGATNGDKTKGIALAYIDSREVTKRLDDVCGIDGWQDRLKEVTGGFISEIDININERWVTRSNAAGNTAVDPVKGGASDAFKRAASKWGIGRYLYYLPNVWVSIKPAGKSYALAEIPALPKWAKPDSNIERWEDIAEREAATSSGADEVLEDDTSTDGTIASAKTRAELRSILNKLSAAERKRVTPLVNSRMKELAD